MRAVEWLGTGGLDRTSGAYDPHGGAQMKRTFFFQTVALWGRPGTWQA